MIRFEYTGVINRPVQEVFDYVANFETLPEYDKWVISAKRTSDGPIGVGTTWTHDRQQGPQKITAPIKLVEYDSPRRFAMQSGSGAFDVRSTMTFEPAGDAKTKLTEVLEMRISGFQRLLQPIISRQVPKQGEAVHHRLKEVLEARPA